MIKKMKQSLSLGVSGLVFAFTMAAGDASALDIGYSGSYAQVFEKLRVEDGQIPVVWGWAKHVDEDPRPRKIFLTTNADGSAAHILVGGKELDSKGEPRTLRVHKRIEQAYFPLAGRGNLPDEILFPESVTDLAEGACMDISRDAVQNYPRFFCNAFNNLVHFYTDEMDSEVLIHGREVSGGYNGVPVRYGYNITIVGIFTENNQRSQNGEQSYAVLISSDAFSAVGWEGTEFEMTSAGWTPAGRFLKAEWTYQRRRANQGQQRQP